MQCLNFGARKNSEARKLPKSDVATIESLQHLQFVYDCACVITLLGFIRKLSGLPHGQSGPRNPKSKTPGNQKGSAVASKTHVQMIFTRRTLW